MVSPSTYNAFGDEPIQAGQRRALFAAGNARGLSIEELRAMTPAGSISMLTRAQASDLLDRLNAGTPHEGMERPSAPRGPRRSKGVMAMATVAQLRKIDSLRIELGWTVERLAEFLKDRHYSHGGPMSKLLTTRDGIEVIELLKDVCIRQNASSHRRPAGPDAHTESSESRPSAQAEGEHESSNGAADRRDQQPETTGDGRPGTADQAIPTNTGRP